MCMLCSCANYDLVCGSVRFYMTSTKTSIYNYYMPMYKKNKHQDNLPIGSSKTMNVRKLHNSRVHNINLLQYNAPFKTLCILRRSH